MWYSRSVTFTVVVAAAVRPSSAAAAAPATASATATPAVRTAIDCRFLPMAELRGCGEFGLAGRIGAHDAHLVAAAAEEDAGGEIEVEPACERGAGPAFARVDLCATVADGGQGGGEGGEADSVAADVRRPR